MHRIVSVFVLGLAFSIPTADSAPAFPVSGFGWKTFSPGGDADQVPWAWYGYSDHTYDEGEAPYDNGGATGGGAGTWSWNGGNPELRNNGAIYTGTWSFPCVTGTWAWAATPSIVEGNFYGCGG